MANGTVTVEIFSRSWVSYGTITSAFVPRGTFKRNDAGDGIFVFPIYDTPAKTLVKYNRIAVVTLDDNSGANPEVTICAFHIQNITPRRVRSGDFDGYAIEVSGSGILAELQWDNVGYATISDGSQGPTDNWPALIMAYAQETWSQWTMGTPPGTVDAYLQAAGETVWDALLECAAQVGRSVTYAPTFATQAGLVTSERTLLFLAAPVAGGSILPWNELNLVASNPGADEVEIIDIEPMEDVFEIATRVTAYGAGIGADVFTIAAAQGNVTVPSGFSVDWANSIITHTTLEAETDQPIVHRLKQFGHIKPEDNDDATAVETAAIQLFWAGINYLEDRRVERRTFYKVTFVGYPGSQYTVGQLVNIVYAHTSPINASGTAATTNVIDINGDFVVHDMTIEVPNDGEHKGVRLITMVVGSQTSTESYARARPSGDDIVINKLKEHDEVLRHATASYAPSTPGGGGTYATADAPFLVLGNTTNLTNERLFVAGAGLAATDGGANNTYTVNVAAADTSLTINADSIQVRLATTSGLTVSTGLMIDDTIAGAGLTIASKVLAVGGGDGIDVAADSIAVDVTDIIGDGLVEVATNNIALGTPGSSTATSTNAVTASSHTHAIDSTIARSAITITAGAGLTGGGDLTANRTINVATADTSITINADSIQVRLATTSGLTVSTGLMIDDSIAGAGLTIASKVLAVGGGDGIDVAADSIAVDVTDIIGDGLVEVATNNIALGTPSTLTVATSNGVTTTSHTHAITSSSAVSSATAVILATDANGRSQVQGFGVGTAATGTGVLDISSKIYINETADANVTTGLVINQGTADNAIITLKSSEVTHGMTDFYETDTYAVFAKSGNGDTPLTGTDAGGLLILGMRDADGDAGRALVLAGYLGEAAATTVPLGTTGSSGVVQITAAVKSGTGGATVADDGNMFSVSNFGVTRWVIKGDGRTYQSSSIFVNDTANTFGTIGLTLNQGANDDEIISLKSSDVAHGVTDTTETDTFGVITKAVAAEGGVFLRGYTEGSQGARVSGVVTTGDTTKSTAAVAAVVIQADKKNAATFGAMGTNENLLVVRDNASTRWIVDKEGDTHRDGTDSSYDVWDDAQLVRAFDVVLSPSSIIKSEFDDFLAYGRDHLIAAGILHESGFYNESQLLRLHNGAIWQEYTERQRLALRVRELEQRLLN